MSMPPVIPRRRLRLRNTANTDVEIANALVPPGPASRTSRSAVEPHRGENSAAAVSGRADERIYTPNGADTVFDRYRVGKQLGYGSFGTVVHAEDTFTGAVVAIKLLHKDADLNPDPRHEERVYKKVLLGCDARIESFAAVLASGTHHGFHCIVFELCGPTLHDVIQERSGFLPLPARHLREIGYQIIRAVQYLHSLGMVHTDIKPDNIAVRSGRSTQIQYLDPHTGFHEKKILVSSQICILDLGNAVELKPGMSMPGRVAARPYRAPESLLGMPWRSGVDAYAIGCVIAEMYLARNVYDPDTDSDREHLAAMDRLLGPFPYAFAQQIEALYPGTFTMDGAVRVLYPSPQTTLMPTTADAAALRRLDRNKGLSAYIHDSLLHALLRHLMALDPASRVSLEVAAKHPYFDPLSKHNLS